MKDSIKVIREKVMANWAKNVLQVNKTTNNDEAIDIKRVKTFFNSIRNNVRYKEEDIELLIDFHKIIPVELDSDDPDWRDKTIAAWGTKGCYAFGQRQINKYTIEFLTAWQGVPELMAELSRQNPDIILNYTCDLDTFSPGNTSNIASFVFQAGNILMELYEDEDDDYTNAFFNDTEME